MVGGRAVRARAGVPARRAGLATAHAGVGRGRAARRLGLQGSRQRPALPARRSRQVRLYFITLKHPLKHN